MFLKGDVCPVAVPVPIHTCIHVGFFFSQQWPHVKIINHRDSRAKYLINFINENKLKEVIPIKEPTFNQHSGKGQSQIDYIFINQALQNIMVKAEYTTLNEPLNSSPHDPVLLYITIRSSAISPQQPIPIKRKKRPVKSRRGPL